MKRVFTFLSLAFLLLPGFSQYNSENLDLVEESAGNDFTYGNLRLYPITASGKFLSAHEHIGKYTPLKSALEGKKIAITEHVGPEVTESEWNYDDAEEPAIERVQTENNVISEQSVEQLSSASFGGETVNTLFIENISEDTVFIMAGEVVKGGKQDRVIAQDMVIPPASGKIDLSVFCVESGRWTYNEAVDQTFNGYANVSSMNVRKAAMTDKNQSKVWSEVELVTKMNQAASETSAYTQIEKSEEYQAKLKEYLSHFKAFPNDKDNIIGMVGVTGNRVIGCDMFATPDLFRNQFQGLLHSYATEAFTNGEIVSIKNEKVSKYVDNLLSDESKQEELAKDNGMIFKSGETKLHVNFY